MRLLISEYICGGSWPEEEFPETLAREGAAMLRAVVEDFLKLGDLEVWTTWDSRLGPPPFPAEELESRKLFLELVGSPWAYDDFKRSVPKNCDAVLIIAPETGGILSIQCQEVEDLSRPRSLNSTPSAIELCGDKSALHRLLVARGISMPRQWTWENRNRVALSNPELQFVLKLRDGAGSQEMQLLTAAELLEPGREDLTGLQASTNWIIEEYVAGRAISVAAIFNEDGALQTIFPPAEQHLSADGHFVYMGGSVPAPDVPPGEIQNLVTKVSELISGLRGYIGFDIVLPDVSPDAPCLIEINPRLTTSYVGYRQITTANLARWLIPGKLPVDPPQFTGSIHFKADGTALRPEWPVSEQPRQSNL